MGELVFLIGLSAIAGYYYYETLSYTVSRFERTGGPAVFPQLLVYGLLIFIVIRVVQILVKKEKPKFKGLSLLQGTRGIFFFSFVAYVLLMTRLGFVMSATLYLIGISTYMYKQVEGSARMYSIRVFGVRCVIMVVFVIAVNYFFSTVLNVEVPTGFLGNL